MNYSFRTDICGCVINHSRIFHAQWYTNKFGHSLRIYPRYPKRYTIYHFFIILITIWEEARKCFD